VRARPGQGPARELTDQRPDVPWSDIARRRDLIGYHYYMFDAVIVRATIGEPLARIWAACEAMLAEGLT